MQTPSTPDPLRWQQRRAFLVGVTAAAGWLDALAFLYLGKVFLSFMSGNLLFVGIAAGTGDGDLLLHGGAALGAFLIGTGVGARMTGSQLAPGASESPMIRTLQLEAVLLAVFAVLWLAAGTPADHPTLSVVLIVIGAAAMGLQASVALAFHLPNVPTVAMTATLAQLAALFEWREREGRQVVARTPAAPLMTALCLAYVIAAVLVATVPETAAMAFGPVVMLAVSLAIDARTRRAPAMRGTRFNHVSVYARNLEESVAFYTEVFGMERIPSATFPDPVAWLRLGDQELHLLQVDEPTPRFQHFALTVDDFEAVYVKARALGIQVPDGWYSHVYELPDGAVQMYVRDPDGNLVEIDWPDVTTLDRSVVTDITKLADAVPQNGDAGRATLFPSPGAYL